MNPSQENLDNIRHSLAHLLAAAVLKKFPKAKLGIGPTIENGFYYDFELPANKLADKQGFTPDDLIEFEKEIRHNIKASLTFSGQKLTPLKAKTIFKTQKFKLELIKDLSKEKKQLTLYKTGEIFQDLCRGGHVRNTNEINPDAFKLTHTAGAYWKGDEKKPQLQRIYGVAFENKEDLEKYWWREEEAKKRDHRKLGKELGLYTIIDEIGSGLPLFYPKGAILRRLVENFITELQEQKGYLPIWIPHITKGELYKISGHLDKYDAMYPPVKLKNESDYYLKPMNCPHFMMLYKSQPRSYRDLPIRWTSTTTNYRLEKSGELTGLTRVRSITQDDCHVFCEPDDIEKIINEMLDMISETYKVFGFHDFSVRISTHDPKDKQKYIGNPKIWGVAEEILTRVIKKRNWKHEIGIGEAAFYGPKLDFIFKDALGRDWQLSTIQLDMNLPSRFELHYTPKGEGEENSKPLPPAEPVVIHRAILGSTERFLGILIEHFAGAFPLWLSPIQARVLAISDKQADYANKIFSELKQSGIRAEISQSNETLGKRIRQAQLDKIPYLLIVGDKEKTTNEVSVRHHKRGDDGVLKLDECISKMKLEIDEKII